MVGNSHKCFLKNVSIAKIFEQSFLVFTLKYPSLFCVAPCQIPKLIHLIIIFVPQSCHPFHCFCYLHRIDSELSPPR